MTHRERVLAAVARRAPDRVPLDLGGTLASTMTERAHGRLRAHLGFGTEEPPTVFSRRASTVIPDDAILRRFDVDCRPLVLGGPEDRVPSEDTLLDEWGIRWWRPEGGHYIPKDGPLERLEDPVPACLDRYAWPDPADPVRRHGLRERAAALHGGTDCAVVLNLGVGPVHQGQYMRGYAGWLADLLERPAFAEALLDLTADFWITAVTRALEETAPFVDLVCFGDDIGTQRAPLMRPALYRRLVKPRHRRMVEAVKRFGKPVVFHTCGAVLPLITDLIDIGIDALNPVQVSAAGMDASRLKREFGGTLAFWGAIDTQQVLPWRTPEDVRREVARRIAELGEGGGYVLCAVHNIQAEVPPENVVAMYEAALEYGEAGR